VRERGTLMNRAPHRQRGIALLIALLTVALAVILIAALLDRGELALARTRNALRGEQAEAYAQGLEAYAAKILMKDLDDDPGEDSNTDIWAAPLPPQPVAGGTIVATMRDLNGCFNINNLGIAGDNGVWLRMFGRLLAVRGVDPAIGTAIQNWLGAGNNADITDAYYLAQPVPYRSAQRPFAHVSELRLVQGVTSDVYARLAPYLCALPPGTPINVNTASVPVLQTLGMGQGMSQAQAESLWNNGQANWTDAFITQWQGMGIQIDPDLARGVSVANPRVGVTSNYFLARGDVNLDGIVFTFYSLMQRATGLGVEVLERSRGSDDALVVAAPIAGDDPDAH
jgi:general secretion pathway protein K